MKIEKITYQKTYSIGPYLTDRVGFEASLSSGENEFDALTELKESADEWHKREYPHLYQEVSDAFKGLAKGQFKEEHGTTHTEITFGSGGVTTIIDLNHQRLRDAIDDCQSVEELQVFKEKNPALPQKIWNHYNERLKALTNGNKE